MNRFQYWILFSAPVVVGVVLWAQGYSQPHGLLLIKGKRLPTSEELAVMESLHGIVDRTISMIPASALNVDMDDYSRLYNYTEPGEGGPISMKDLMEGELYRNLARIFDGLDRYYGKDGTPEVIFHFFGQESAGGAARRLYSEYQNNRKTFLSDPVYPPSLSLHTPQIQEVIRRRLAQGVDYRVADGFSRISGHRMMQGTIIQNQWELTKDKIRTLPFIELKNRIFSNTPKKVDAERDGMMFPGLTDYEITFYMALGSDLTILSLKREYETWLAANRDKEHS